MKLILRQMQFGGEAGDPYDAKWLILSIVDSDTMHNLAIDERRIRTCEGEMDVDL